MNNKIDPSIFNNHALAMVLLETPIAFYRSFAELTGSVSSALFLSYLVSAVDEMQSMAKNTIVWDSTEVTNRTALSLYEQTNARKQLINLGYTSENRVGVPPKVYIHLNEKTLVDAIVSVSSNTSLETMFMTH